MQTHRSLCVISFLGIGIVLYSYVFILTYDYALSSVLTLAALIIAGASVQHGKQYYHPNFLNLTLD